jgi:hypothetical protein
MSRQHALKYRSTPEGKQKDRARRAVNQAIKNGKLVRPDSCQLCTRNPGLGSDGRFLVRADHYLGYEHEHWLDVQWVCPECDGALEIERRGQQCLP